MADVVDEEDELSEPPVDAVVLDEPFADVLAVVEEPRLSVR